MLRDSRTDIDFNNSFERIRIHLYLYINRRILRVKSFYQEGFFVCFPLLLLGPRGFSQFVFVGNFIRGVEKSQHEGREKYSDQTKAHWFRVTISKGVATIPHNSCPFFSLPHLFHDRIFHHWWPYRTILDGTRTFYRTGNTSPPG